MSVKFTGDTLLVATHNAGKLHETQGILAPFGITVKGAAECGLPEPDETETTFVGNAKIKARAAMQATGLPALADDSGIEVEALNGAPGVYTADWAETPDGRDFMMAMEKTHRLLEEKNAPYPRRARFCATLVMAWPNIDRTDVFEGHVDGSLVWPPRGREGHGYDPIFKPDGYDITFAEMSWDQKNKISHRARAIEKLLAALL